MIPFSAFYLRVSSLVLLILSSFLLPLERRLHNSSYVGQNDVGRISGICARESSRLSSEASLPGDDLWRMRRFLRKKRRSWRPSHLLQRLAFYPGPAPLVIEIEPVTFCIIVESSAHAKVSTAATMDESHVDEQVCETSYKVAHKMMCWYLPSSVKLMKHISDLSLDKITSRTSMEIS